MIKLRQFAVLLIVGIACCQELQTGSVDGQVIAQDGRPLVGIRVTVLPLSENHEVTGKLEFTTTDQNGKFRFGRLSSGPKILATKGDSAGYPNTMYAAFAPEPDLLPKVDVQPGKTNTVSIRLRKGGRLVGQIINAATRHPLPAARIRFTRIDSRNLFVSTGPDEEGKFDFALPEYAYSFSVTADGFKEWHSKKPIRLRAGEEQKMIVRLEKAVGTGGPHNLRNND